MIVLSGERQMERAEAAVARATEAAVAAVRARIPSGESPLDCVDCGGEIPQGRRAALPGVETCVDCAAEREGRR
jgi:phage/conjugal plasmid C-4 type zinc finger TraR family protein